MLRQALSNRFYTNQQQFEKAYTVKDIDEVRYISEKQLELLKDMDALLSHRSEFCLSRWIGDSHKLAADEAEQVGSQQVKHGASPPSARRNTPPGRAGGARTPR